MDIRIGTNAADVAKAMRSAGDRQIKFALSNTVNDLAFDAQRRHKNYTNQVFDRPTRWTQNATRVWKSTYRSPSNMRYLAAWVGLNPEGGKGGNTPLQYLRAQATGGQRKDKRYEVMLKRKGILPSNMQTIVMPKYQDRYGNIRGSLVVKILSYVRAFSEVGYNMNRPYVPSGAKGITKTALRAASRTKAAMDKNADTYFVMKSANSFGRGPSEGVGIARRYANGKVEPILMFVVKPTYQKRYDLKDQVMRSVKRDWFKRWKTNYAKAVAGMKVKGQKVTYGKIRF